MSNPVRYFVTNGPLATRVEEVNKRYFLEAANIAGTGVIRVVLPDGGTELVAGSRYLEAGTSIRAEVEDGRLKLIYLGEVLREYDRWADFTDPLPESEFPPRG